MASLLSCGKISCSKLFGCESVSLPKNIVGGSNRAIIFPSASLVIIFFSFQREILAKLSDLWIRFWVYNQLKEAVLPGSGKHRRGGEGMDFGWEAVPPCCPEGL